MKVLKELAKRWKEREGCVTVFNEGGSRSGKTIDTFQFLIMLAQNSKVARKLYTFRSTLIDCKDMAFEDFKLAASLVYGEDWRDHMQIFNENQRPDVTIGKSNIFFRGLDKMDKKEGFPSDIIFVNEVLSGVSKEQFDAVTMRCTGMIIADWNPRFTQHWIFDYEKRPNVFFTHTTYKDNKHCPRELVERYEGYAPTPENIAAGTASNYRYKVYCLGERCAQEGVIFEDVDWISTFPADLEHTVLGIDFGYTNDPTAIVRIGRRGFDLYLEELYYSPISNPEILCQTAKSVMKSHEYFYADSADKYAQNSEGMVTYMQMAGIPVIKAKKYSGSIIDGVQMMQSYTLHIVKTNNFVKEQGSYVWASVNGISLNVPADGMNHLWDAARYVVMSELRYAQ